MTAAAPPGKGRLLLVVEDDDDARECLSELLVLESFKVVGASNGRAALEYLRSGKPLPSVILLDLRMPVMDGFAFREEQRAIPAIADIPVVVMSAEPTPDRGRLQVQQILQKPLSLPLLLAAVQRSAVVPP